MSGWPAEENGCRTRQDEKMIPIQKLLNRIRWDQEFGRGEFVIAYLDRRKDCLVKVGFERIIFEPGKRLSFKVMDEEGVIHSIPFHRVKEVYKDGGLIWKRPPGTIRNRGG